MEHEGFRPIVLGKHLPPRGAASPSIDRPPGTAVAWRPHRPAEESALGSGPPAGGPGTRTSFAGSRWAPARALPGLPEATGPTRGRPSGDPVQGRPREARTRPGGHRDPGTGPHIPPSRAGSRRTVPKRPRNRLGAPEPGRHPRLEPVPPARGSPSPIGAPLPIGRRSCVGPSRGGRPGTSASIGPGRARADPRPIPGPSTGAGPHQERPHPRGRADLHKQSRRRGRTPWRGRSGASRSIGPRRSRDSGFLENLGQVGESRGLRPLRRRPRQRGSGARSRCSVEAPRPPSGSTGRRSR